MINVIISDLGGVFLNRGIWRFYDYLADNFSLKKDVITQSFLENYNSFFSGKIMEEEFWKKFLQAINLQSDWKKLRKILLNLFEPNEDVIQIYAQLRKKGYKIILLSDQTKEWWHFLNKKFEISKHFDDVIISALVGFDKSDIRLFEMALNHSHSKPSECLYIEDLEHNLHSAKKLGIQIILFKDSQQLKKELKNLGL